MNPAVDAPMLDSEPDELPVLQDLTLRRYLPHLSAVAFGGGRVVAVGRDGSVLHGTTGPFVHAYCNVLDQRAVLHDGTRFRSGATFGQMCESDDGVSWTRTTGVPSGLNTIGALEMFQGTLLVGEDWLGGEIWTRTSNGTWTSRGTFPQGINDFAASASIVVAVGDGGQILRSTDGMTWTVATSNTSSDIRAVAYGAAGFVSVGPVLVSSDGVTWTPTAGAPDALLDITFGEGLYVAVGTTIATSTDGLTWTSRSTGQPMLTSVTYDGARFVAVGAAATVMASDDGITWSTLHSGIAATTNDGAFGRVLRDVVYGPPFVAVGTGGLISTSIDGITWTDQVNGGGYQLNHLNGVAYHAGRFVAVGYGDNKPTRIITSTDGVTWQAAATDDLSRSLWAVTHGPAGWVAVGSYGQTTRSQDGLVWTTGGTTAGSKWMTDVIYFNGNYIACSVDGTVYRSVDGAAWTATTLSGGPTLWALGDIPGALVVIGAGVYSTNDGTAWSQASTQGGAGVTRGLPSLALVGNGGAIFTSAAGQQWARVPTAIGAGFEAIAAGGGRWVVVGKDEVIMSTQ